MLLRRVFSLFLACALAACAHEAMKLDGGRRDAGSSKDSGYPKREKPVVYGEAGVARDASDSGEIDACTAGRRILVDEVINARDLGGVPLENGATVACGALYRGAAITALSEGGCAEFIRLGIRTVIDLRTEDERLSAPYAKCVTSRVRTIPASMPVPTYVSPEDYLTDLYAVDSVAASFDAFGDETAYPIYFNCYYGRDRTGVLAAVILLTLGATRQDVIDEYQLTLAAGLATYPESLEAALDEIEKLGGIDAYLDLAGVPQDRISVLRARATEP